MQPYRRPPFCPQTPYRHIRGAIPHTLAVLLAVCLLAPGTAAVPSGDMLTSDQGGIAMEGIGIYLTRTPEKVGIWDTELKVSYLSRLVGEGLSEGGLRPRVVYENETFPVAVTVEALGSGYAQDEIVVVLVPPPGIAGTYHIERTSYPDSLNAGERGTWNFAVTCVAGSIGVDNLSLAETGWVANLTGDPALYTFHAFAFCGDQSPVAALQSDPVLSIRGADPRDQKVRRAGEALAASAAGNISLPATLNEVLRKGTREETLIRAAQRELRAINSLDREDLTEMYRNQAPLPDPETGEPSSPVASLFQYLQELFSSFREFLGLTCGLLAADPISGEARNSR